MALFIAALAIWFVIRVVEVLLLVFIAVLCAVYLSAITDVLERRELSPADCDVYLCGPPPMIDAALPLLETMGVPNEQVFYDKFTITAAAEE